MIPLGIFVTRQRLAAFRATTTACFASAENRVTKDQEVRHSLNCQPSVCQNRYPSPSRWPAQRYLGGSPWFCTIQRVSAGFWRKKRTAIEYQSGNELLYRRATTQNKNRGTSKCKNHLFLSRPSLVLLAVRKAPILSVLPLAVLLAVWRAILSMKAIALSVLPLVPPLALWPTTSTTKLRPVRAIHIINADGVPLRAPFGVAEGHLPHV